LANALVYIELCDGAATRASLQALNHGRHIATRLGATLYAIVPCAAPPGYGEDDIVAVLSRHGADKVVLVTNPQLASPLLHATHGLALRTTCDQFPPQLVLLPASAGGRDVGARLALELDGYYAEDVTLEAGGEDPPTFSRVVFRRTLRGRQALAEAGRPLVLSVASSEHEPRELGIDEAEVVVVQAPTDERAELRIVANEPHTPARLVIGGGGGLGADEYALLTQLADRLDAPLLASGSACEAGLADEHQRAGLDGHAIEADIYLAVGVSGSERHLASLGSQTRVLAINADAEAPIGKVAQALWVADAGEALRELLDLLDDQPAEGSS
jgi:electron transfer flavoprotein alpha subunit